VQETHPYDLVVEIHPVLTKKSYLQENLDAHKAKETTGRFYRSQKGNMCWKCMKEKKSKGGHIKIWGNVVKFICAECMAAKKAAKSVD
jgi:hypothetical protein